MQGKRFLTDDMLASQKCLLGIIIVSMIRCSNINGVNIWIGQDGFIITCRLS